MTDYDILVASVNITVTPMTNDNTTISVIYDFREFWKIREIVAAQKRQTVSPRIQMETCRLNIEVVMVFMNLWMLEVVEVHTS